jgi:high-affinity K+ transport system ATPase subunit B
MTSTLALIIGGIIAFLAVVASLYYAAKQEATAKAKADEAKQDTQELKKHVQESSNNAKIANSKPVRRSDSIERMRQGRERTKR